MTPDELSRRRFLGTLAAGSAAIWLEALHAPPADAAPNESSSTDGTYRGERLVTLTAAQAADLDAFAAQIIPSGPDGLGAREAGSVFFVDRNLAGFAKDRRPLFAQGLAELRAAAAKRGAPSFAALPVAAQTEVLRAMEAAKSEFFDFARAGVVVGMFADPSYGGNRGKVGWKLLGFEDRFHWTAPFGWYDREAPHAQ